MQLEAAAHPTAASVKRSRFTTPPKCETGRDPTSLHPRRATPSTRRFDSRASPKADLNAGDTRRMIKPAATIPALQPLPRRGLNRVQAALYVGVSATTFDQMVA